MDRRSFFSAALDKGSKVALKAADSSVKKSASRWVRPPYAIDELSFLLACTRCGDCIAACPHTVIFALSARVGAQSAGTPALDLLHKGCHLCEDWPCVSACKPGALQIVEPDKNDSEASEQARSTLPRLANAAIDEQTCLPYNGPECGACISACPVPGALTLNASKPMINKAVCTGCGLCRESCITEPKAIRITSLYRQ
jgi:ferredoxin-type protein NapG